MRRCGWILSLVGVLACAHKPAPTEPPASTDTPAPGPIAAPAARPGPAQEDGTLAELRLRGEVDARETAAPGSSKEHPLPTCGPQGSYIAVADVECDDGSRPLDGDVPGGMRSRRGSLGPNATGHIIDLYEVTCPDGPKQIYVDMYGCDDAKPSPSKFAGLVERCLAEDARGPGRITVMIQTCVPVMPTALRELGKPKEADAWLAKYCAGTPTATEAEPKRYRYLARVLEVLEGLRIRQGKSETEAARERKSVTAEFARTCAVDPKAYEAWWTAHPDL
jgi:hypothetical protein